MRLKGLGSTYLVCFLIVSPLVVLWSLATPVMAVADDPNQIFAAAAAVRGEFHQPFVQTPFGRQQAVQVPGKLAGLLHAADCIIQSSSATPNQCAPSPATSNADVTVPTQFMRYPPLFGWLVGWPTLFLTGTSAYWAVTLLGALLNSALLATALWVVVTFAVRRLMILGFLLCLTPGVLYLAGSADNSGFEIAAATAAWSAVLVLVSYERPPPALVVAAAATTSILALARPASPLWVAILLLSAGIVAGWTRIRSYLRQRQLRWAGGAVVLAGVLALAWRLVIGAPTLLHLGSLPAHPTLSQATNVALANERGVLDGLFGMFLATQAPFLTVLLWLTAFAGVAVIGFMFASRRTLLVAGGLATFLVLSPIVTDIIVFSHLGLWWQSRYGLPVCVGLPLVLAAAIPDRLVRVGAARRVVKLALLAIGLGEVVCFVALLHRYGVGINGSWRPFNLHWEPPGDAIPLSLLFTASTAGTCYLAWRLLIAPESDPADVSLPLTGSSGSIAG